jgi:molecular chaperone GrpE
VNREPDQPRSKDANEDAGGDGEGDGTNGENGDLNLPLDALLDWGTDPTKLDEELQAALEIQTAEAILAAERDEYLDALRRLQADFDNFRKRTLKQQTDILERAAQALVEKLLPVLDAADLAVAHGGDVVAPVVGLLVETLQKEGLETVAPGPGSPFDPMVHEAVSHEAGDGGPQEVVGLLRAGYRWKGTLLRPAMVSVRG